MNLKNLKSVQTLIFTLLILCPNLTFGKALFQLDRGPHKIIDEYLKTHKKYFRQSCKGDTEQRFWKYFRSYRGKGYYVPEDLNGKLDKLTVNRFIPELKLKLKWIAKQVAYVKRLKNFKKFIPLVKDLQELLTQLLNLKERYYEAASDSLKINSKQKSRYLFITFKSKYKKFLKLIPFLESYRFPNDHFELRQNYDKFKYSKNPKGKQRANEIYFYRKIVQDGSQNPNRTGSDTFLRTGLDTIYNKFQIDSDFIPEHLRFDISVTLKQILKHLKKGRKKQLIRLQEWEGRISDNLDFYESLRQNKVLVGDHYESGEQILDKKSKDRYELKNYVIQKQKDSYEYWKKETELMRALFVIETILFNEVGGIDGRDALERKDVTQVVLNRFKDSFYNSIQEREPLYPLISSKEQKGPIRTNPWLNLLFKEGEFSFTYYFIHGSVRIFCPDQTRRGRFLRRENLRIALDAIAKPRWSFPALRYFSRASMLGRYDMGPIWSDFSVLPEKPGLLAKQNKILKKHYDKGDYAYMYHFKSSVGKLLKVVEIKNKLFVFNKEEQRFYNHRSPHFFQYFQSNKAP